MIHPSLWDDEHFLGLSVECRLLWCFFKSSEAPVPGILRGSILTFSEALRFSAEQTTACLRELIDHGRVELDDPKRLLRVIDPVDPPPNQAVVLGWFRKWQALPDCPLKYRHLVALEPAVLGRKRKWSADVWAETFGQVLNPYSSVASQTSLFEAIPTRDRLDTMSTTPSRDGLETVETPSSRKISLLDGLETVSSTRSDPEQDPTPDPEQDPERHGVSDLYGIERRLWDVQEQYRAALRLPKLIPTDDDLATVREGLEATGFGPAEAELALKAHYQECERDVTKARHFNGSTNWRPKNLRVAATRVTPAGNGTRERDLGAEARKAAAEPPIPRSELEKFRASWGSGPEGGA